MSLPAAFAVAAAAAVLRLSAPPYTLVHTPGLEPEAARVAGAIPSMVRRLESSLGAPPLPPSTLCLLEDNPRPGHFPSPCDLAALMPEWAAGIALPEHRTVIVRADRAASYPHRHLLSVVTHETAHLVEAEAAGGPGSGGESRLPAWFREGVAAMVSHEGEWMDFLYLWTSPAALSDRPLAELESRFRSAAGGGATRAAYAGSYAFLRHMVQRHGEDFPARVLAGVRAGLFFEEAFLHAAGGTSLREEEIAWAASMHGPLRWIAMASSSWILWAGITLLFLLAWLLQRRRLRRIMQRWEEDDRFEEP